MPGRRGRTRKPTRLHVLEGTFRKDRHGDRLNEPRPRVGAAPPPWLPAAARVEWDRLSPRLLELGLLTELDGDAFAAICILTAQLALAVRTRGADVTHTAKELRQLWGKFGMTPADRSKVSVKPDEAKDELGPLIG